MPDASLTYLEATDALGLFELRQEVARRFNQGGAIQALSLIAQFALDNRPAIICETPCFQGVINSFTAMGHWEETVQRDAQGPRMDVLERLITRDPQLLYLCPYAHNPMGTDLGAERASQLADWAHQTGSVIIADEIFKDLRHKGPSRPSLLTTLGSGQTIVISSLSKTIASGLRLGSFQ